MASAWGDSWGSAWGDSWGAVAAEQAAAQQVILYGGGRRRREQREAEPTRKELDAAMMRRIDEVLSPPVAPEPEPVAVDRNRRLAVLLLTAL